MPSNSQQDIHEFLTHKRIALVGVSRNPREFSRSVWQALRERGYDLVPVNHTGSEIEGVPSLTGVSGINPPVKAVLVMTPPAGYDQVVQDCAQAGVTHIWLHGVGSKKDLTSPAAQLARQVGMKVIAGICPFMFMPNTPFLHRIHTFFVRMSKVVTSP